MISVSRQQQGLIPWKNLAAGCPLVKLSLCDDYDPGYCHGISWLVFSLVSVVCGMIEMLGYCMSRQMATILPHSSAHRYRLIHSLIPTAPSLPNPHLSVNRKSHLPRPNLRPYAIQSPTSDSFATSHSPSFLGGLETIFLYPIVIFRPIILGQLLPRLQGMVSGCSKILAKGGFNQLC